MKTKSNLFVSDLRNLIKHKKIIHTPVSVYVRTDRTLHHAILFISAFRHAINHACLCIFYPVLCMMYFKNPSHLLCILYSVHFGSRKDTKRVVESEGLSPIEVLWDPESTSPLDQF